jgi:hypothetical protein
MPGDEDARRRQPGQYKGVEDHADAEVGHDLEQAEVEQLCHRQAVLVVLRPHPVPEVGLAPGERAQHQPVFGQGDVAPVAGDVGQD